MLYKNRWWVRLDLWIIVCWPLIWLHKQRINTIRTKSALTFIFAFSQECGGQIKSLFSGPPLCRHFMLLYMDISVTGDSSPSHPCPCRFTSVIYLQLSSAQQNCFLHFIFAMPVFSSSLILWESLHISNWYLLLLFTVAAPNMFHLFQAPHTLLPSSFLHTLHQENNDHNICTPSTGCCSAKYILTGVKTKAQIGGRYLLAYINVKRLISKLYFKNPMNQIRKWQSTRKMDKRFDKHFIEVETLMAKCEEYVRKTQWH